jgi:protein phosphatase-4 regulatory subunit 3
VSPQGEHLILRRELSNTAIQENMKDLIHHVMTKHESKIRLLVDSPVVGPRFQAFIRRWEQNCEPPPVEEKKTT